MAQARRNGASSTDAHPSVYNSDVLLFSYTEHSVGRPHILGDRRVAERGRDLRDTKCRIEFKDARHRVTSFIYSIDADPGKSQPTIDRRIVRHLSSRVAHKPRPSSLRP